MAIVYRAINDSNFRDLKNDRKICSNFLIQRERYTNLINDINNLPDEKAIASIKQLLSLNKNSRGEELFESYLRALLTEDSSQIKTRKTILKNNIQSCLSKYESNVLGKELDYIIGHVSGAGIHLSPFISFAPFDIVASEYSIPQNGKYNTGPHRKIIIGCEYNNTNLNSSDRNKRSEDVNNLVIELNEVGKLQRLVDEKIIIPNKERFDEKTSKVTGFDNFAAASKEILFYKRIDNVKYIINPFLTDLIFACSYSDELIDRIFNDINSSNSLIKRVYHTTLNGLKDREKEIINKIYNIGSIISCSIKDFQYDMEDYKNLSSVAYDICIENENLKIEEIYEYLKSIKRCFLQEIINYLNKNKFLDNDILKIEIVDDRVYVLTEKKLQSKKLYKDLLFYQDEANNIYEFIGGKIYLNSELLSKEESKRIRRLVS